MGEPLLLIGCLRSTSSLAPSSRPSKPENYNVPMAKCLKEIVWFHNKTMCCIYELFGFSFNLGSIKPGPRTSLAPMKKRVWQCVWWTFANDFRLRCTISPSFQTLLTQMEIARVTECVWVFLTCRLLGFNIVLDTMKRLSTMKVPRGTECGWASFNYRLLEFNNILGTIKPAFQMFLALIKVARVSECVSHVYF